MDKPIITVSGQEDDVFVRTIIQDKLKTEMEKLKKIIPIDELVLHIDRHNESGTRVKYAVRARLITEKGLFFAQDHEWDLTQAVKKVLDRLEREVIKKKEMRKK